jgi:hypothetical protein
MAQLRVSCGHEWIACADAKTLSNWHACVGRPTPTRAGFTAVVPFIAPGITERALQIEIEAELFRHGADTVAYDSIIASGPNAAVLHHLPTQRPLRAGELVLIDAGRSAVATTAT